MEKARIGPGANAMAFYHQDGFVAAWQQAMRFAGHQGRIATMPDIVAARLAAKPGDAVWESYYTTLTAEYFGVTKRGNRILIVAHGIGPMSTLDGIQKAYSWEFKDKDRSRRGGRITQQEFWDLEAGKYGYVEVIDFESYCRRYRYPFMQVLRCSEAVTDPVLRARLGMRAEEYIRAHTDHSRAWHCKQAKIDPANRHGFPPEDHREFLDRRRRLHECGVIDPYIISMEGPNNCRYTFTPSGQHREIEQGYAIGHLIATSRLGQLSHDGNESLVSEVGCHEWWNGVRIVGIRNHAGVPTGIQEGPDAYQLIQEHWRELLCPVVPPDVSPIGFRALVQIAEQWFTQYPKTGARMDSYEAEYVVFSMEEIGEPVLFRTTVGGYHGFFKYAINEVESMAPPGANAYRIVSEPQIEWHGGDPTHHTVMVQFCRIEADTSQRLMREQQLSHDYQRMMQLHQQ